MICHLIQYMNVKLLALVSIVQRQLIAVMVINGIQMLRVQNAEFIITLVICKIVVFTQIIFVDFLNLLLNQKIGYLKSLKVNVLEEI